MELWRHMTCCEIQHQHNAPGMLIGYAQIDSHPGPELLLWKLLACLHVGIQNKDWASKRLEVIQIRPHR
jgi:hypothetical protein